MYRLSQSVSNNLRHQYTHQKWWKRSETSVYNMYLYMIALTPYIHTRSLRVQSENIVISARRAFFFQTTIFGTPSRYNMILYTFVLLYNSDHYSFYKVCRTPPPIMHYRVFSYVRHVTHVRNKTHTRTHIYAHTMTMIIIIYYRHYNIGIAFFYVFVCVCPAGFERMRTYR